MNSDRIKAAACRPTARPAQNMGHPARLYCLAGGGDGARVDEGKFTGHFGRMRSWRKRRDSLAHLSI
jgi:hypothetical protein